MRNSTNEPIAATVDWFLPNEPISADGRCRRSGPWSVVSEGSPSGTSHSTSDALFAKRSQCMSKLKSPMNLWDICTLDCGSETKIGSARDRQAWAGGTELLSRRTFSREGVRTNRRNEPNWPRGIVKAAERSQLRILQPLMQTAPRRCWALRPGETAKTKPR
jgi:hypothetical protein